MRSKFLLLTLFFCVDVFYDNVFAQAFNAEFVNVVPPSPDASALSKVADVPVNISKGSPSLSLPIYTIKQGSLTIPISLMYNHDVKVNDIASWVGLGWSLSAGGIISRTVHGLPDNMANIGFLNNSFDYDNVENLSNEEKTNLANSVRANQMDMEPDSYTLNLNGSGGRFFIKKTDMQCYMVPRNSRFKIVRDNLLGGWSVYDTDGTIYRFSVAEGTSADGTIQHLFSYLSSWYLTEIISSNNDTIKFEYQPYTIDYFVRNPQIKQVCLTPENDLCVQVAKVPERTYNTLTVNGYRLLKIKWQGGEVRFNKTSSDRLDVINDYALNTIEVYNYQNTLIKKVQLEYDYFAGTLPVDAPTLTGQLGNKRLRLKKVKELPVSDLTSHPSIDHTMEYYSEVFPYGAITNGIDLWGYYNGKESNINLIPKIAPFVGDADRAPNEDYSKYGVLKRINYPTGGYTNFNYELNKIAIPVCDYFYHFPRFKWLFGENSYNVNSTQRVVPVNVPGKVCEIDNYKYVRYVINLPSNYTCTGNDKTCLGTLSVLLHGVDTTHSVDLIASAPIINGQIKGELFLNSGKQYVLEIDGAGSSMNGVNAYAYVEKNPNIFVENNISKINLPVGGLRVKEIEAGTSNNQPRKVKRYLYHNLLQKNILQDSVLGSGRIVSYPKFENEVFRFIQHEVVGGSFSIITNYNCSYRNISSVDMFSAESGYEIEYESVQEVETDNDGLEHRILTTFKTVEQTPDMKSYQYPYGVTSFFDYNRGQILKRDVFLDKGTLFTSIKSDTTTTFSNDGILTENAAYFGVDNYIERYKTDLWDPQPSPVLQYSLINLPKFKTYTKRTGFVLPEQKIETTTDFNNRTLIVQTNMEYHSTSKLLTKQVVKNSEQKTIQTEYKYPIDFSANSVYNTMIQRNITGIIVEQTSSQLENNSLVHLSSLRNNYQFWDVNTGWVTNTTSKIFPESVDIRNKNNSYESRVKFNSYTANNNLSGQQRTNDVKQSYLWGYNQNYPVAQIVNAGNSEIFHDNFEELKGWDGNLSSYDNSKSKTGKYSGRIDKSNAGELYSHNTKWLDVNVTAAKKFKYSVWVYSTGPGAEIFLFMRRPSDPIGTSSSFDNIGTIETNKWVLLEKEVTVPAGVIQLNLRVDNNGGGSVWFDDVRLHPSDAQMTTYTFNPLIGVTSQTDLNNRIQFYEYDAFNRLSIVRDHEGKIVKKICYNYAGQEESCGAVFYNQQQSGVFTKNNCSGGQGSSVTYVVAANAYSASTQAAANTLALNDVNTNGQAYANQYGTCLYSSANYSGTYYSAVCASGAAPQPIYISVPAGMFTSAISQIDANNQAYAYAQNYANTYGTCSSGVEVNAWNDIGAYVFVELQNTSTNQFYYLQATPFQYGSIGTVPAGNYNVTVTVDSYGFYSFGVGCYNYSSGNSAMFYNITINSSCNTVSIY